MNFSNYFISTYLIGNCDNFSCFKTEFASREEFDVNYIYSVKENSEEEWNIFRQIVEKSHANKEDAIVLCRNRGHFSKAYSKEFFFHGIFKCADFNTHLLVGGCVDFNNLVPVTSNLFWVDRFIGGTFLVLFSSAYRLLLNIHPKTSKNIDTILSETLANKLLLCPMIFKRREDDPAIKKITLYYKICNKYHLLVK